MKPSELFQNLAMKHGWPAEEQVTYLFNIIDNEPRLAALLTVWGQHLDSSVTQGQSVQCNADAPPPSQQAAPTGRMLRIGEVQTPFDAPADDIPPADTKPLADYIDRSLSANTLENVPEAQFKLNEPGNAMIMTIPKELWANWNAQLTGTTGTEDRLLGGFKAPFNDGAVAGVLIMDSPNGAYVDAFIVLPANAFPDQPNPSLPPRRDLVGDLIFDYPDGTQRFIRLVPAA